MQKLMFESSWDKALSNKDRIVIEKIFQKTNAPSSNAILLTLLWQAFNHKGELLVTMLIHNFTEQSFSFNDTKLKYIEDDIIIAEHSFKLPSLIIHPAYSMPWTFIFPASNTKRTATFGNGRMVIC